MSLAPPDPWRGLTAPDSPTVVVLGAGGPAGWNLLDCLGRRERPTRLLAYDAQPHRLATLPAIVERRTMDGLDVDALERAIGTRPALVLPQPDPLVALLSRERDRLPHVLPGPRTIELAQDKASTALIWAAAGQSPGRWRTVPTGEESVEARRRALLDVGFPMWLRARTGAGARLACRADHRGQADLWCRFVAMRFGETSLLAEEYLPGRDYGVTLVYWHGRLAGAMARERLEYLYPQHAVSGRTGTPTAARLILAPEIESAAVRAVEVLGAAAREELHGVYCVDLREDERGEPVPTEVNAGRFFTTSHVGLGVRLDLVGLLVGLALGEIEPPADVQRMAPEFDRTLVVRHIDMGTHWITPAQQKGEIEDWFAEVGAP